MNPDILNTILNRLAKWRMVYASWQLGTRADTDPECRAVRDHREATILLRAEVNALTGLLMAKGVFTQDEFAAQLRKEAEHLHRVYEAQFPGFKATDQGMSLTMPEAAETMRGFPQ
jgi:hypothetical protein